MPGPAPGVSVILATYNRRSLLPAVLAPVLGDPAAEEVIVVIDGSRDGSLELLRSMAETDSRLHPVLVENGGAARARLTGAQLATRDHLVIIDDDEIVDVGTISGHARHHCERDDLVVSGFVEMKLPPRRRPDDFARYIYARQYARDCAQWEAHPEQVLLNLWGGYISLRREKYLAVMDGSDDFVQGYHDDLDFGARCLKLGLQGRFDPSLRAVHLYERSRARFLADARTSGRNRILVHRAHPEVLEPIDAGFVERAYPPVRRLILRAALAVPALVPGLSALTTLAGRLHLWPVESAGGGLLWGVEQKRGAREVEGARATGSRGAGSAFSPPASPGQTGPPASPRSRH